MQEKNFGLACVITMQTFFILPTAVSVSGGLSCRLRLPYPGDWLHLDDLLIEWGGGLRWLRHDDAEAVHAYAKSVGGWCWAKGEQMPIDVVQSRYMNELKRAFDPQSIFSVL